MGFFLNSGNIKDYQFKISLIRNKKFGFENW